MRVLLRRRRADASTRSRGRSPRARSSRELLAAPGSDAIADLARCFPDVAAGDVAALVALARAQAVDLVVVGPGGSARRRARRSPARGRDRGVRAVRRGRAARGEQVVREGVHGSDIASRPRASPCSTISTRRAPTRARQADGCVVKADGLAAGKGVAVCDTPEQALAALDEAMRERRFGAAGDRVVIEERLVGEEASYYAITDGEHVVALAAAQDHKRIGDGDRGENTGGMGAYAPAPIVDAAVEKKVLERIVYPAIRGLAAEGTPVSRGAVRGADDRRGGRPARDRVQRAVRRSGDAAARDADGERSRAAARRRRARRARARGAAGESRLRGVRGAGLRGLSARGRERAPDRRARRGGARSRRGRLPRGHAAAGRRQLRHRGRPRARRDRARRQRRATRASAPIAPSRRSRSRASVPPRHRRKSRAASRRRAKP